MATLPPKDSFGGDGATLYRRPRPGRSNTNAAASGPNPTLMRPAAAASGTEAHYAPGAAATGVQEFISDGANPLLQSAVPLLILAARLRGQFATSDVESLRQQCIQEVREFEERARVAQVAAEDVLAARYCLCTAVDEAVLNTPWGSRSGWARQSLLVSFQREAEGGEKFFQILQRLLQEARRYHNLIELLYVCLALGFEGRYRLDPKGPARLSEIRQDVYRRLEEFRGGFEAELSPQWRGIEDRRNAVMRVVPLWVVGVTCALLLAGAFILCNTRLNSRAAALNAALVNVGLEKFTFIAAANAAPAANAAASPGGLSRLLAPQIEQQLVRVVEQDGRTRITSTVPELFASGSARVNPRYGDLIHAIGVALNATPGSVLVIGHTDDQPVRSLQYPDNFALSRARALAVAQLLASDLRDAGRIDSAGKGDSDPLYTPPNLPDNRARNRRVEIIHVANR